MDVLINLYRRVGVKVGDNCRIFSPILPAEPYLVSVGNNVTIAPGVKFITHDNSVSKVVSNVTDVYGQIVIGDNCFIGANTLLLPGVTVGDGSIIAAGSVVTKSCDRGVVVGGNPVKYITSVEEYRERIKPYCVNMKNVTSKKEYILNEVVFIKK